MTVGIVSYLSQRGLGTMCQDLRQHLGIDRQLVVPDAGWPMCQDWMNGEEFYLNQWEIEREDLVAWQMVDKIDTLISIETGFGDRTFQWAKELGMRTVLIVMWEHFNPNMLAYQNVDLYVCPSFKAFQEVPFDNKIYLPYPVDVEAFIYRQRQGPAKVFIHNAGSGGVNGRKGTVETVAGFILADVPGARLIVRSQVPFGQICPIDVSRLDKIEVQHGSVDKREDLYNDGDVLIYPSRYDGHSLVGLEAMAAGMPVITTDAEPMNEYWNPGDPLCVRVAERKLAGTVNPHCLENRVDIGDLTAKIRWCAEHDMSDISTKNRQIAESQYSWAILRNRWIQKLGIKK